jgi:hypothetical protein
VKSQKYYRLVETTTPELADQRKKLSDDIKEYLASGKQIEAVPRGASRWTPMATIRPKQRPIEKGKT